jgi:cytochrome c oxidase subunit IV
MSETYFAHEFQYSSARHQADSAISGMWLFLATEVLFFGALLDHLACAARRVLSRVPYAGDCGRPLLEFRRHRVDRALPLDLSRGTWAMTPRFRHLWLSLLVLLVLLAIELGLSFLPLDRSARPLVLIPAVLMVGTVGTMFMEVGRGPEIVRVFAVAGVLWLTILLGLGSLDPLTRTDYQVQGASPK